MLLYIQRGKIPAKRHTQFRKPDGGLYSEQLFSTEGFSNDSSLLYHVNPSAAILHVDEPLPVSPKASNDHHLKPRSFTAAALEIEKKNYANSWL